MTTCAFCLDRMAARSERQRGIREANLVNCPEVTIGPCPQCGGIEWATTNARVAPDSAPISNKLRMAYQPSSVQLLAMAMFLASCAIALVGALALVMFLRGS